MPSRVDYRAVIKPLDDPVGYRLSALADGEGHFAIAKRVKQRGKPGDYYACSFVIKLRADDAGILNYLQRVTELGKVYAIAASGNRKAQASWQVWTKQDCRAIVDIFDAFPLWSKKRRDFLIWRDAVELWSIIGGPGSDWSEMEGYFHAIRAVRAYPEVAA